MAETMDLEIPVVASSERVLTPPQLRHLRLPSPSLGSHLAPFLLPRLMERTILFCYIGTEQFVPYLEEEPR
jgi:hypothetical protein